MTIKQDSIILSSVKKKPLQAVFALEINVKHNNKPNNHNSDNNKLDELIWLSLLFDFYGELLGDYKKQIFEDYILNDLSLSEVADEAGISRQGVHDIIKRCTQKLNEYEEKLHLAKKFEMVKNSLDEINKLINHMKITSDYKVIDKIEQISQDILNEL